MGSSRAARRAGSSRRQHQLWQTTRSAEQSGEHGGGGRLRLGDLLHIADGEVSSSVRCWSPPAIDGCQIKCGRALLAQKAAKRSITPVRRPSASDLPFDECTELRQYARSPDISVEEREVPASRHEQLPAACVRH
jgi:hypothetical protein